MNRPNYSYPNGINSHYNATNLPKHIYREMNETRSDDRSPTIFHPATSSPAYFYPTTPMCGSHQFTPHAESGICDGMDNCHLADSWVNYMNQRVNLPITQINHIPILNSYIPTTLKMQPSYSNHFYNHVAYHKSYLESIYEHQKSIVAESASNSMMQAHPKLQLFNESLSQSVAVTYEASTNDDHQISKTESSQTIYESNSTSQRRHSKDNKELSDDEMNAVAKMCIKFQDRNKKLDFKTNFRDENLKVNGCFYDSENDLSPKMRSKKFNAAAPPKKKWIKNYMTTFADAIKPETVSSSLSPSLVVISRPSVNFTPQTVSIDLSKNANALPLSNGTGNITIFNIDESQTSLNLSTESSGYVSNSTTSSLGNISLNQSAVNCDELEIDGKAGAILIADQRIPLHSQSTFSALPMPPSTSSAGRRRTISSNSNSSTLRSPSTVRAGTREVHNKLEKNRRAHLKECFDSLKRQLPITADEKKTSNLSILGAAIRHIQFLKKKEREYEHEMERLAKEKIAAQNRILFLKRELAQWDVDFSKLFPEQNEISAVKSERSDSVNDSPYKSGGLIFNPSPSLTGLTTPSSTTPLSSNASPPRITSTSSVLNSVIMPIALTPKEDHSSNVTINPVKMPQKSIMPIGNGNGGLNLIPPPPSVISSCQSMPLNLHATATLATIHPPPPNGLKNGLKGYNNGKDRINNGKSTSPIISASMHSQVPTNTPKHDDPPTKLIKLINGSAILAPMDSKDNGNKQMLHSGQLTLQQVVGGGGLVVSPIQLLTSSQGFKVINQPNGLTTIELSPQINGHPAASSIRSTHHLTGNSQPGNLQKLLMNGNGASSLNTNTISIPALTQHTNGSSQLAPGGAELNLLPSSNSTTTNNGAIYRNQGKLTFKETNNSSRVHVVQSTPTIMVSQPPPNTTMTHIITSSPQLTGKVRFMIPNTTQQYLSSTTVKPMIVVNHQNGNPNAADIGKN